MLLLTSECFDALRRLVYERSDLYFPDRKKEFFEDRLKERSELLGYSDYESYSVRLMEDPHELDLFIQCLTTGQTYFFRNPAQFKALRDDVLPELKCAKNREVIKSWGKTGVCEISGRHPAMSIRVWSAGCSTGEETYSIAFTLLEAIKYPRAWNIEVLGTDIKEDALRAARSGKYQKESVGLMDPGLALKYMERDGSGFSVKPITAASVKFARSNLKGISLNPGFMALHREDGTFSTLGIRNYFDIIFCRNVMIYFDHVGQQRLVSSLYDSLKPGGCLFTGDSEPLHLFDHGFTTLESSGALYYRKP